MCKTIKTQEQADEWSLAPQDTCLHIHGRDLIIRLYQSERRISLYGEGSCTFYGAGKVRTEDASLAVTVYGRINVSSRNGRITAWDHATVTASGTAKVKAGSNVVVTVTGNKVQVEGGMTRREIYPEAGVAPVEWARYFGVDVEGEGPDAVLTVYKCVDEEYRSSYARNGERTSYAPGAKPVALDWSPTLWCGQGLHFSPTPFLAKGYYLAGTRYMRCRVLASECVTLGDKIKAKRVIEPCDEVEISGRIKLIETEAVEGSRDVTRRVPDSLLERARKVPYYQGQPNARGIARELRVSRSVASDLAYRLRVGA
jgi:hypothetical protein